MTRGRMVTPLAFIGASLYLSALFAKEPTEPLPPLPDRITAAVNVFPQVVERSVSPTFIGNNLHPGRPRESLIAHAAVRQRVRQMGTRTIRFPNGCIADLYNWRDPSPYTVTVGAFLDFCEAVEAEAYYTLNMQGGTEGLEGPLPEDAPLQERIKYRHTAPNPCGQTNFHFGTLDQAIALLERYTIQRALDGKTPLTHFELGNENWGQAKTDWPPQVYGKTCEVYADALRQRVAQAKRKHPQLADLELYIVMVGYPTMGNNQDPFKAVDRKINVAWTAEVNRLAELGLIDAVQEHFYPYGNNNGSTLLWTVHNLHNILALRYGVANERLGGYRDEELAYVLPVESTEWNIKCWGNRPRVDLPLTNGGFEDGLKGWTVEIEPPATGSVAPAPAAARRGTAGARLFASARSRHVEIRQTFSVADRMPDAALFGAALWLKTDHPLNLQVTLRQANAGAHQGDQIKGHTATQTNMWERVIVAGKPFEDTTDLELVIRLAGAKVAAWADEVQLIHWPTTSNVMPLAANTFEQQLFLVDALRELLHWPTPRTHLHHLIGNYPCPTLNTDGAQQDNARAFELLNQRIGDRVVRTDCEVPALRWFTHWDGATDFNAATPSVSNLPALSALATRKGSALYLLLVNRTTDRTIDARISFHKTAVSGRGELRTLTGTDLEVKGARVMTKPLRASNPMTHRVPPHSAQVLKITEQTAAFPQKAQGGP